MPERRLDPASSQHFLVRYVADVRTHALREVRSDKISATLIFFGGVGLIGSLRESDIAARRIKIPRRYVAGFAGEPTLSFWLTTFG
jgi:hypothetical protein